MTIQKVQTRRARRQAAHGRALLKEVVPFREWIRAAPRSEDDIRLYRRILREIGAMVAGQRPNVVTFRWVAPAPKSKPIEPS